MRLAIFDELRFGIVSSDGTTITDVTDTLPSAHDPDPWTEADRVSPDTLLALPEC